MDAELCANWYGSWFFYQTHVSYSTVLPRLQQLSDMLESLYGIELVG